MITNRFTDRKNGGTAAVPSDITELEQREESLSEKLLQTIQQVLRQDPVGGHLFLRGCHGDLLKVIWYPGQGASCSRKSWNGAGSCGGA